jgi:hypothetical protein
VNYRIRYHPLVARDLDAIVRWILDYEGRQFTKACKTRDSGGLVRPAL